MLAIQALRNMAFLSRLLPLRAGNSPLMEVPLRLVTGAMPA